MAKIYTVSDGKLVLTLRPAGGGWYTVTYPLDPRLVTQARSIEEAFVMARDALKLIRDHDQDRVDALSPPRPSRPRKAATSRAPKPATP